MNQTNKNKATENQIIKFCWMKTCCLTKTQTQPQENLNFIILPKQNNNKQVQKNDIKVLSTFLKNKLNPIQSYKKQLSQQNKVPKLLHPIKISKNINGLQYKNKPNGLNFKFKNIKQVYSKRRSNTNNSLSPFKSQQANIKLSKQKNLDLSTLNTFIDLSKEKSNISKIIYNNIQNSKKQTETHNLSEVDNSIYKKLLNPEPGLKLEVKTRDLSFSPSKYKHSISPKSNRFFQMKKNNQINLQNQTFLNSIPKQHKIINFGEIKTVISPMETFRSKYSSTQRSDVIYRNSGNIGSLLVNQQKKLQKYVISDFYKRQSSAKNLQLNYNPFNSNSQQSKITQIQVLNQDFNEKTKLNNDNNMFCIQNYINKGSFIGIGRFSTVYLAECKRLGFLVAMKQILKSTIQKNNLSNQLRRQMCIHNKVRNQNIIQLYSVMSDQKRFYLIMELGQTNLRKLIKQKSKIPQKQAIKYLKQIINGLSYLHANNIIHRDIKPQNIIMINNVCKIADFGWAVQFQQLRNSLCGTSDYASPQMLGLTNYDFKLDSWSVGIIAYEMVFGKLPFNTHYIQNFKLEFDEQTEVSWKYKKLISDLLQIQEEARLGMNEALSHQCFL